MTGSLYVTNDAHTLEKWEELVDLLKTNRYFIDKSLKIFDFIDDIQDITVNTEEVFYRARLGSYDKAEELGTPPIDKVKGGRLNPKAIPYLYVARSSETAISEIRPWIGATVSIAKCTSHTNLKIKDFTSSSGIPQAVNDFKRVINNLFATKLDPSNNELEYMATQAIAEFIKGKGYEGIQYLSSTHAGGINLTVFEPEKMRIEYAEQLNISSIQYQFSPVEQSSGISL